ncbi:MAG TPA: hypothetical protein VGC64_02475 [Pyrinomonadaceae bacterium]|jgi:hypothetical protein
MCARQKSQPEHREPQLKAALRAEMETGMSASRDPQNAGQPDLAPRVTTIYSPWYTRACPVCKNKFRDDDRVRLCPLCEQAYHDDDSYHLHCWQERFKTEGICKVSRYDQILEREEQGCDYRWSGKFPKVTENRRGPSQSQRRVALVTTHFLQGLEAIWKPYGEEAVFEVEENSAIIGHNCPWCRFQVRAGDRVVRCPCGKCSTYFHNDVFRHLTCWNDWNGSRGNDYCPTTGAKIIAAQEPPRENR